MPGKKELTDLQRKARRFLTARNKRYEDLLYKVMVMQRVLM